jgi:hypothetical protein
MKRMVGALLALLELAAPLGCQPKEIDALRTAEQSAEMDGSGPEAAGAEAQPDGGPAGSPLAYYSLDEGTGSVVHDDSGHGHDGRLLGGAWTDAGRFGGAIRFSASDGGADDGVLVDPFPQPVRDWSVSFWLLVQSPDLTGVSTVLSTEVVFTGGWEVNLQPGDTTFGSLEFAFWAGTSYSTATCACVALGSWTHIAAVVDGSALTVQLFQDGVAVPAAPALGKFVLGNPYLYMGRWGGATARPLVGVLDEVAIFDRTLSTAEVTELYAGVVP